MQVDPDLMIFVMEKNLMKSLVQCLFLDCHFNFSTDLLIEILKIHEKEAKNNQHSHKVRDTKNSKKSG